MKDALIPFIVFALSLLGLIMHPKNNLALRILVIGSSIVFLVVRFAGGEINEMLLLIFTAVSAFVGLYYHLLVEKERS
ncbi:MAG: hypothetical protein A2X86_05195 [Bdellovibrionales bacterium GWA2_49_15]|nr:MAG: hypothetical protein A2X86_05195 [Bdellovibrionales bacterium GWA2_49_15]